MWVANLGVGLFNLLPLGIVDGGKMFYLVSLGFFKKEEIAKKSKEESFLKFLHFFHLLSSKYLLNKK